MNKEAVIGGIIVGGQPNASDLATGRFKRVINVREDDEAGNVTAELVRGRDVTYVSVPFTGDTLSREHIERIAAALEVEPETTLVH